MTKRVLILLLAIMIAAATFGCSKAADGNGNNDKAKTPAVVESNPSIVWREADPPPDGVYASLTGSIAPFDMHQQMTISDLIFKGRIVSHQNYEVSWVDKEGMKQGPEDKSILQVQILEVYVGKPQNEKDIVRVYFPFSTDTHIDNSFPLKDGGEYIFFAMFFGERNLQEELIGTPYYKDEIEKYADMSVGDNNYMALPIENGMVVANVEYDYERKAVSLKEPGSAHRLAPESFELFQGAAEGAPIIRYALFSEEYFVSALKHFAEKEGKIS